MAQKEKRKTKKREAKSAKCKITKAQNPNIEILNKSQITNPKS
jgi:hypothetical protein